MARNRQLPALHKFGVLQAAAGYCEVSAGHGELPIVEGA
jgi:hypothetical protein